MYAAIDPDESRRVPHSFLPVGLGDVLRFDCLHFLNRGIRQFRIAPSDHPGRYRGV